MKSIRSMTQSNDAEGYYQCLNYDTEHDGSYMKYSNLESLYRGYSSQIAPDWCFTYILRTFIIVGNMCPSYLLFFANLLEQAGRQVQVRGCKN